MNYSFHPAALQEYSEAIAYYSNVNPRLADSFVQEIEAGIQNITRYPRAWQVVVEDYRRYHIDRFPLGIYYAIEEDHIQIYAVMHLSRRPKYWLNRTHNH